MQLQPQQWMTGTYQRHNLPWVVLLVQSLELALVAQWDVKSAAVLAATLDGKLVVMKAGKMA